MKMHTFMSQALLVLALMAEPALAQKSQLSMSSDLIATLSRLGSQKGPAQPLSPAHDAVALGLAKAKVYKVASADYPGASTNLVLDQNLKTVLGITCFASPLTANCFSGFTLKGGAYALLKVPGATSNQAGGINTNDQIVGSYIDASNVQHGFLYNAGVITTIDDPAANPGTTVVDDINDAGEMVGSYQDASAVTHGFSTLDGITFTTLDFPGGLRTFAFGVNTAGDIVGQWYDGSAIRGFLYSGGVFTSIDFPLAKGTSTSGINDSGEIAGYFVDASNNVHGFVYSQGAFTQIDVSGAISTELSRIKNDGHIMGVYSDSTNELHGMTGH